MNKSAPRGWTQVMLGECVYFVSGSTPSKSKADNWGGNIAWLSAKDMKSLNIFDTEDHLTETGAKEAACIIEPGTTLLLVRGMTLLKAVPVCVARTRMAFNQDVKALRSRMGVASEFVPWLLSGKQSVLLGAVDVAGHGTGRLATNTLAGISVLLPPEPEQRAIAAALSDADALIAALDHLIAKKRAMKRGTMQQLLTGKRRLAGFAGGWKQKRLEQIAPLQRGFDLPTSEIEDGPFPVVYSNGVMNHHNKWMVEGPGVVTGRSGTIGRVHFVAGKYWPHNTSLWVTSFCGNDPKFVFYLYSYLDFSRFLAGSGVPTLNRNDVHKHATPCPDVDEQRAIAAILSDMDTEIAALQRQREKMRAVKQGMMQSLLAGRVRLMAASEGAKA